MYNNCKLFSKEVNDKHIIYRFLGLRVTFQNPNFECEYKTETKKALKIQNGYDLTPLKSAKKMILFLTPSQMKISGGVMSIYSLCEVSRELNPDFCCILSTYPNDKYTYASNDYFYNNEKIYRFSQIVDNCKNLESLMIHIPDYYAKYFYGDLKNKEKRFLSSVKNLHINILNQNIDLMAEPQDLESLFKLTTNVTQTTAHDRYATQEVCNKWQIPTHLFLAMWDMSKYKKRFFEEKEKIIVLSPDENENKEAIVSNLKEKLADWQFVTVENMTFAEYMDLISKAFFTVTFGEGFDGYFTQPLYVGSIGISVYNDKFFPDKNWAKLDNVFSSYEEMEENCAKFILDLSNNRVKYNNLLSSNKDMFDSIYNFEEYRDNIKRFYEGKYDYLPQKKEDE